MLLLALGRVGLGPEGRLIPYEIADERFKALWEEFSVVATTLFQAASVSKPIAATAVLKMDDVEDG